MNKIKILQIIGLPDSNQITVTFIPSNQSRFQANYLGNCQILNVRKCEDFEIFNILVGNVKGEPVKIPRVDLVYNSICDPDGNPKALTLAKSMIEKLGAPVMNHPDHIMRTGRENIYRLLHKIEGLKIPKTIRIEPKYISDIEKIIKSGEMTYPFIIKEAGYHSGKNIMVIKEEDDLENLQRFAFDGRAFYLIEFFDFKSRDGLYRKYRIVFVGGEIYPVHLIISNFSNIHFKDRAVLMDAHPEYRKEELTFLENFNALKRRPELKKIYEELQLDYFGMDFSFGEEKNFIVFEINGCVRSVSEDGAKVDERYQYCMSHEAKIWEALQKTIRGKLQTLKRI